PRPTRFADPALAGTPLQLASEIAAGIFNFSGFSNASFARFTTVTVPAVVPSAQTDRILRSGDPALLTVSGNEARTITERNGDVVLYLLLQRDAVKNIQWAKNPCFLTVPTTLAVTYSYNLDSFITQSTPPNKNYHTGTAPGDTWTTSGQTLISTAADLRSFLAFVSSNSAATAGKTYTLDYDIDLANGSLTPASAPFLGTFHGGNHKISNFSLNGGGLFSQLGPDATVEFLQLHNAIVTLNSSAAEVNLGVVAGINHGRLLNVAVTDSQITLKYTAGGTVNLGGLVGNNQGSILNSYFENTLHGTESSANYQSLILSTPPSSAIRMAGLVGFNQGRVVGGFVAAWLNCNNETANYSWRTLVGLNDGGQISYCYWQFQGPSGVPTDDVFAYSTAGTPQSPAVTSVPGKNYYVGEGTKPFAYKLDRNEIAQRLSADSYGNTYQWDDANHRMQLHSFKLAKYDLSAYFEYLMLSVQYASQDGLSLFSNGVCSWKGYVFPNFANLSLTSQVQVSLPILPPNLTYQITAKTMAGSDLLTDPIGTPTVTGIPGKQYTVGGFPTGTKRVLLYVSLSTQAAQNRPWGVYRSDSTHPIT
ncbi:MAG: hypothetical protein RSB55_05635, partial [Oscillospiraceae bacterium]